MKCIRESGMKKQEAFASGKFNTVLKENKVKDERVCVRAVWEADCRLRTQK